MLVLLAADGPVTGPIEHGMGLLRAALEEAGCRVRADADDGVTVLVSARDDGGLVRTLEEQEVLLYYRGTVTDGGFALRRLREDLVIVAGTGDRGALYGCQELAGMIRAEGGIPGRLDVVDGPAFALRGPALALQKTHTEPPRSTYDYPVTPGRFPWFYDRAVWTDLLDRLLGQRANVVYIWTGHPFASFAETERFPEAVEVTPDELAANGDTLRWLTAEAGRRGIQVILTFYNIHLPLPFAQRHGLDIHQSAPSPLVTEYYQESVAEFVRQFPDVGFMICLGEALRGDLYGLEWLTGTLLPAINEGWAASGQTGARPPVIIRSHVADASALLPAAREIYPAVYTEAKYNGESLTTCTPRGHWQRVHRELSAQADVHIVNIHILANLEPFRWGAPSFIQRCLQAARYRLGARGLHLYPLCFWDWPDSPDAVSPPLRQADRDWIWYESWFRYAWNPDRDRDAERRHWTDRIARRLGLDEAGAGNVLDAFEDMGESAPRLLRRLGITEGNRQTWSLGMTLAQLAEPGLFMPWKDLWESHSPAGERLGEYVRRLIDGGPHTGETPVQALAEAEAAAERAAVCLDAAAAAAASQGTGLDTEAGHDGELERLRSDAQAVLLLIRFYRAKTLAAAEVVRYRETGEAAGLPGACELLDESVRHYRELAALTARTYRYANSMQTTQRKVPFPDGSAFRHWTECLPEYEREAAAFRTAVAGLGGLAGQEEEKGERHRQGPWPEAPYRLQRAEVPQEAAEGASAEAEEYLVEQNGRAFTDGDLFIVRVAPELAGLKGIRFSQKLAMSEGVALDLDLQEPSRVLVGYFVSDDAQWLRRPSLETDAHAEERGGLAPVLTGAVEVYTCPPVDVHALAFPAGRHTLALGKGAYLLLGVVPAGDELAVRDVQGPPRDAADMTWLTA